MLVNVHYYVSIHLLIYVAEKYPEEVIMWFFKKSAIRPIPSNACWGHLVRDHNINVDTISATMRRVMKEGAINGLKVMFLRIFNIKEIEKNNINITGRETFDRHPELLAFEGYVNEITNQAFLERKNF